MTVRSRQPRRRVPYGTRPRLRLRPPSAKRGYLPVCPCPPPSLRLPFSSSLSLYPLLAHYGTRYYMREMPLTKGATIKDAHEQCGEGDNRLQQSSDYGNDPVRSLVSLSADALPAGGGGQRQEAEWVLTQGGAGDYTDEALLVAVRASHRHRHAHVGDGGLDAVAELSSDDEAAGSTMPFPLDAGRREYLPGVPSMAHNWKALSPIDDMTSSDWAGEEEVSRRQDVGGGCRQGEDVGGGYRQEEVVEGGRPLTPRLVHVLQQDDAQLGQALSLAGNLCACMRTCVHALVSWVYLA